MTILKRSSLGAVVKNAPDWEIVKLSKYATAEKNSFTNGPFGSNLLSSELMESGIPVVYIRDICNGRYERVSTVFVTNEKAEELSACKTEYGDVVITKVGDPPCVAAQYNDQCPAIVTQDVIRIKTDGFLKSSFLVHLLNSEIAKRQIKKIKIDGTRDRVSLTDFKKIKVPQPSISEQEAIADILSTWDRAIEKNEALIAAKERRKKGLMQQLLTGRVRFGEFVQQEWREKPLGALFEEVKDVVGEKDIPPYSISAGIGFVSQRDKWGKDIAGRQYSKYTHLRKGDFAYNKGNSKRYQCGCAYLLREEDEISVPNVFISFRKKCDDICVDFYEHFFIADYHARELRMYITSGARSDGLLNLNKRDFFKILVPCPAYAEQKAIAAVLNKAVAEIETHKKHLAALKTQKRGLMQQLLTGKVRVNTK